MHLNVYMAKHKLRDKDIAQAVGVSRATVSRWRNKLVRPDWPQIESILKYSKGHVGPEDWRKLDLGAGK